MAFPIIPKKRSGASGYPTTLEVGELAVNTLNGELYLGGDSAVMLLNGPVAAGTTATEHTGDGTTTAFTFAGYNGTEDGGYIVSVGGIDQPPSKYAITSTAGGTITFVEAPVAGELISIRALVAGSGGGGSGDATSLQGVAISTTAPSNANLLIFDSAANEWQPKIPTQLGTASTTYGAGTGLRFGDETVANNSGIAIGYNALADPYAQNKFESIAIGNSATTFAAYSIAIGQSAKADSNGSNSIAIGPSTISDNGGIAIGYQATTNGGLAISAPNLTNGTPSNPGTVVAHLAISINGTNYFIPLVQ
jgi:hypothetical protein